MRGNPRYLSGRLNGGDNRMDSIVWVRLSGIAIGTKVLFARLIRRPDNFEKVLRVLRIILRVTGCASAKMIVSSAN